MKIFSAKGDKISLECECCHKIYNFPKGLFDNVSEEGCTNNVPIQCPNCKTMIPAGTYIKGNALPYDEEIKKIEDARPKEPEQDTSPMTIVIIFLIFIILGGLLLRGCSGLDSPNPYVEDLENARGKSWFEMTDGEQKATLDLFEWVLDKDN